MINRFLVLSGYLILEMIATSTTTSTTSTTTTPPPPTTNKQQTTTNPIHVPQQKTSFPHLNTTQHLNISTSQRNKAMQRNSIISKIK